MEPSTRARIDQHLISTRALLYRTVEGGSCEIMRDWVRAYSGLQTPVYNIFQPLTAQGLTDETLADTAAFFSSHQTVYAVELVHDRFPDGPGFLDQRYYDSLPPQPAMYLDGLPELKPRVSEAVTVELVTTVASLTAFCTLLHQIFDFPLAEVIKFQSVRHLDRDLRDKIRHYLAFIDERPVGAGTLICIDGVASIWNICTSDAYRQQGVASTILWQMLQAADQKNCRLKVLYSTAQAFHLFNKFDFELYTQRQWFLPPGLDYQEEDDE